MTQITVFNPYFPAIKEVFASSKLLSNRELDEFIADCYAQYLELHHDLVMALTPDLNYETLSEACYYILEDICNE